MTDYLIYGSIGFILLALVAGAVVDVRKDLKHKREVAERTKVTTSGKA